jgi:hypothetical protein
MVKPLDHEGLEGNTPLTRPVLRPHATIEPPMFADEVVLTQAAGSPSYSRAVLSLF